MATLGPKATVAEALRRYHDLAERHVWGGMVDDYALAKRALEALDGLVEGERVKVEQLSLLEVEKDEPEQTS